MDREAQEKIKNYAAKWFDKGREYGKVPITKSMLVELEKEGEELLLKLGYRKSKEKPPLLSDELIEIWERFDSEKPNLLLDMLQAIAQAQREVDIEFYTKELTNEK